MKNLSNIIKDLGITKQEFAELVHIPYYRIATILYGNDTLTDKEKSNIEYVFGSDIFF